MTPESLKCVSGAKKPFEAGLARANKEASIGSLKIEDSLLQFSCPSTNRNCTLFPASVWSRAPHAEPNLLTVLGHNGDNSHNRNIKSWARISGLKDRRNPDNVWKGGFVSHVCSFTLSCGPRRRDFDSDRTQVTELYCGNLSNCIWNSWSSVRLSF